MWIALVRFVLGLLGFVPKGPSADEKLGKAEQANTDNAVADVAVDRAVVARDDADRHSVADPDRLRDPDPYSRD